MRISQRVTGVLAYGVARLSYRVSVTIDLDWPPFFLIFASDAETRPSEWNGGFFSSPDPECHRRWWRRPPRHVNARLATGWWWWWPCWRSGHQGSPANQRAFEHPKPPYLSHRSTAPVLVNWINHLPDVPLPWRMRKGGAIQQLVIIKFRDSQHWIQ